MTDSLLDDVKALLDNDFGDDRILKQICRACEHDEVISNYERNYVRKLAEKHLGRKPEITHTPSAERKPVQETVVPEVISLQKTQTFQTKSRKKSKSSKNTKMIAIGGIAVVAIILAIGISFSGISDGIPKINSPINSVPVSLSIETDSSSYNKKDLISISGTSDASQTVNLSIANNDNDLVWTEQVSLKSDGSYSTLAIAGGQGWEGSGTYTIKVDNGVETKSSTFSFIV